MILCVTPNPAIDRTLVVPGFRTGVVQRAQSSLAVAGGKGLNVARAVMCLGGMATCAGFLGGTPGRYLAELAEKEGIPGQWTWIEGDTRTCVIVADPSNGEATVVNEQGPTVTTTDWERLSSDVVQAATDVGDICFSGSLPPGSQVEQFIGLLQSLLHGGRRRIWVDTSGAALRATLRLSGIVVKVNGDEAGAILNKSIQSPSEAMEAARELHQQTGNLIAITLGAQGAVLASDQGQWWAKPPSLKVIDVVGSGDSFLAGLVVEIRERAEAEALRSAVAAGAANALSVGGGAFSQNEFESVRAKTEVQTL